MKRLGSPDLSPTPLVPDLPPRDVEQAARVYHCSECGERGHSARSKTCHMTKAERRAHRRKQHGKKKT